MILSHQYKFIFIKTAKTAGTSIEVFYADRALETFGSGGAGWFWWPRRRGFAPEGQSVGPFATSYVSPCYDNAGDDLLTLLRCQASASSDNASATRC